MLYLEVLGTKINMPEIQLQTSPVDKDIASIEYAAAPTEAIDTEVRFSDAFTRIVESGVGIDENQQELIVDAGNELISDFGVKEGLFDSEVGSIMFVSLANEYANLKNVDNSNFGAVAAHKEFIANTLVFLAGEHSDFSELAEEEKSPVSENGQVQILDKYTNHQVSEELTRVLKGSDVLGSVRAKMGIDVETEQPFEVRVLNIDSEGGTGTHGMSPSYPEKISSGELSVGDDEYKQLIADFDYSSEGFKKYQADLLRKGKNYAQDMGMEGDFPPAWVTHLDGKTIMCIPLPVAEKILYKEEARAPYYTEDEQEREVAFIQHEYVHTQKMALADGKPHLGVALEELRAEHFSGDKHGYIDIKRHFRYLQVLTGFSPKTILDNYGEDKPFDPGDFYQEIAKRAGLEGVLDYVTVFPRNYIETEDANKLQVEIDEYVGGLSGLQEKEWYKVVAKDGEEIVAERIKGFVQAISKKMDPENFIPYGLGNTFLVNKMLDEWKQIKPDDYESSTGF